MDALRAVIRIICISLLYKKYVEGATEDLKCRGIVVKTVCIPSNYSKNELPSPDGVNPVHIDIMVEGVTEINDAKNAITFSGYLVYEWSDARLIFTPVFGKKQILEMPKNTTIQRNTNIMEEMPVEMLEEIWKPNIIIYNLKEYKTTKVLNKGSGLWVNGNNDIIYSEAVEITFKCPMDFTNFPIDTQSCMFRLGSYNYDDSSMSFTSTFRYPSILEERQENLFNFGYDIKVNSLSERHSSLIFKGLGNFSLTGVEFSLKRHVSTYIVGSYLPSGTVVVLSWISFLFRSDHQFLGKCGRMVFLSILLIGLLSMFNNANQTHKSTTVTAIEAWMLGCLMFIVGAFIRNVVVLVETGKYGLSWKDVINPTFCSGVNEHKKNLHLPKYQSVENLAEDNKIADMYCLLSSVVMYVVFNIIYWTSYCM